MHSPHAPCAPRSPRLVRATTLTLLAVALSASTASAAPRPPDDPALDQAVAADERTDAEPAVVDSGHVDLGPRFVEGSWQVQARDDRSVPPVWRDLDDTVVHVTDAAVVPAPDSPDFAFLQVEPGTPLYVVPQTQDQDVVWLGWNTQDPEVTQRVERGATLSLDGVEGPGPVSLFLQEGVTGPPNVLWDTSEPFPQDLWMDVNTHTHANWVFTEPGTYLLDVTVRATLTDGSEASDSSTLRFAVGSATEPAGSFPPEESPEERAEAIATPSPADLTASTAAPAGPADESDAAGSAPVDDTTSTTRSVALWVGAAAVDLVLAVAASAVRSRRAMALAESEVTGR